MLNLTYNLVSVFASENYSKSFVILQVNKEEKQEFKSTYKLKRQASQLSLLQAKIAGLEGKDNPVFLPEECIVSPSALSSRGSGVFSFDQAIDTRGGESNGHVSTGQTRANGHPPPNVTPDLNPSSL